MAKQLTKNSAIFTRLPAPVQTWATQKREEEFDSEWAVLWCASLNENAVSAHPALLKACDDPNPRVRFEGVRSLLRTGVPPAKALPVLTHRMLHDDSPEVRREAATYLGLLHADAESALPALRQAMNDKGWLVASRARESLEKVESAVTQKRPATP